MILQCIDLGATKYGARVTLLQDGYSRDLGELLCEMGLATRGEIRNT